MLCISLRSVIVYLFKIFVYTTNEIICVGGRLQNSYISNDSKHPLVLPKNVKRHISSLRIIMTSLLT